MVYSSLEFLPLSLYLKKTKKSTHSKRIPKRKTKKNDEFLCLKQVFLCTQRNPPANKSKPLWLCYASKFNLRLALWQWKCMHAMKRYFVCLDISGSITVPFLFGENVMALWQWNLLAYYSIFASLNFFLAKFCASN